MDVVGIQLEFVWPRITTRRTQQPKQETQRLLVKIFLLIYEELSQWLDLVALVASSIKSKICCWSVQSPSNCE